MEDASYPSPPAWLRSYKAQSSAIPNFASQVQTRVNQPPASHKISDDPKETPDRLISRTDTPAPIDRIKFPSTLSLSLHNQVSLNDSYAHSTAASSPRKPIFDQGARYNNPSTGGIAVQKSRRRGPICRFLAAIRAALGSRTQNTLVHT